MAHPDRGLRRARRHAAPPPWSAGRLRSTGSACPASTPPPASPPCSARPRHGRWLHRAGRRRRATTPPLPRRHSCVLETTHETDTGVVRVTDLMPLGDGRADVVRRVEGVARHGPDAPRVGRAVRLRQDPAVGAPRSEARRRRRGHHRGRRARTCWCCAAPGCPTPSDGHHRDEFDVAEGEELHLLHDLVPLAQAASPRRCDVDARIDETMRASSEPGPRRCDYDGPYRDAGAPLAC